MTAQLADYPLAYSGKVRELYDVDDELVLVVASDRISAYDQVLPTPIPDKGRILTALSAWWFERLEDLVPHHLVSLDDGRIPPEVRGRAMLCRRLSMLPVECVARGFLAGSGLADYRRTGSICGIALPPGLEEGSRLPEPIFTPATKAARGEHDENVSLDDVVATVGPRTADELQTATLAVYLRARDLAAARGILLADTKLEFGYDREGVLTVGDEVLTPDSSRFWSAQDWQPGRSQPSFDKQPVRDWLTSPASGWDRTSGAPAPELPEDVVAQTRQRYADAYQLLTGPPFQ
ncbi:MAG TPA: phosphoribosylaminoimidazolesuccinocarboxamide synthase [Actinomycetes bacterium]|nr:phosphoribosylaminoimidazolesuccinocarboxamide synthase [Actinomycetes bacterium]